MLYSVDRNINWWLQPKIIVQEAFQNIIKKYNMKKEVYLGIGTNLGNRQEHLGKALFYIDRLLGKIISQSSIYETQPWGVSEQPDFLNMVIKVQTYQSPKNTLITILAIEQFMGRVRIEKWNSRLIDIDLLFYGNSRINESELIVPHPHISERNFVLMPLNEIAADFIHPVLGLTVNELYKNCKDILACKKLLDEG